MQNPIPSAAQNTAPKSTPSEPATPQDNGMTLEQFLEMDRQALAKLREDLGPDAEP